MEQEQNKILSEAPEEKKFRGYTLNEIRYQRALAALQREFAKEKIFTQANRIRKRGVFGTGDKQGVMAKAGGIASKVLTGFNYVDYAMIGFSAFTTLRKVFKFFRKKK